MDIKLKKRENESVRFYLSSRTVARQVLSALCSLTSVFGMGTGGPCTSMKRTLFHSLLCSHLPIFPDSRPSSIVGTTQLNFCVRYGNRWTLRVNDTNYGAPSGIRTRDPLIKSQLLYQLS